MRAGLWERDARLLAYEGTDYNEVLQLAQDQAVVGLITVGLERVPEKSIPKVIVLQFVGQASQLEQRNLSMNRFIEELVEMMNKELLESRLRQAGVLAEWCAFAAMAVEFLGMPAEAMPLFSPEARWHRKADRVLTRILTVGNFGHNRDMSYYNYPRLIRKMFSLWRHTQNSAAICRFSA